MKTGPSTTSRRAIVALRARESDLLNVDGDIVNAWQARDTSHEKRVLHRIAPHLAAPSPMRFAQCLPLLAVAVVATAAAVYGGAGIPRTEEARPAGTLAPKPFRVMSFNVRTSYANDGDNAWARRAGGFFQAVRDCKPDLIGFQEVTGDQYAQMITSLPEYAFSGNARDDGKRKGEWALIGFRRDRFRAAAEGDFWLSEQPAVAGSKSWDAALPRICSWVRLCEIASGREFIFANTHFDHKGVIARQEASKVLSRELSGIAQGMPAILTGDLNIVEDDPAYALLVRSDMPGAIQWIDAYREMHPQRMPDELTFHAFQGGVTGSRIDFVFHTEHFTTLAAVIDRTELAKGRFPSDHYAVTAELLVNDCGDLAKDPR